MTVQIYKPAINSHIQKIDKIEDNCWIRIFEPNENELNNLHQEQNVPIDFLNDPIDLNEGSRVEKEDDYVLVIIRSPIQEDIDDNFNYETLPMGIILKNNMVYTICLKPIPLLAKFIKQGNKEINLNNKKSILLHLLLNSARLINGYLKNIEKKQIYIEQKMNKKKIVNQDIIDLHKIKKTLVYFTSAIKGNIAVINKLKRNQIIKFEEDEIEFLEDILTEMNQALSLSETYTNTTFQTLNTFTSIISSQLTNTLRILAGVTFFLLLPNLITSIYGMNSMKIPFADYAHNVFMISMVTIMLIVSVIFILRKKKLL